MKRDNYTVCAFIFIQIENVYLLLTNLNQWEESTMSQLK